MPNQEQKTKRFKIALTYTTEVIIEAKDFDILKAANPGGLPRG